MNRSSDFNRAIGFTEEMEVFFKLLEHVYSKEWLESEGENKIQILSKRQDEISTQELHVLAFSIERMLRINDKWTKKQIQKSKSENSSNSKGAIFEIVSLAMIQSEQYTVEPTKDNLPGYDAVLKMSAENTIRLLNHHPLDFRCRYKMKGPSSYCSKCYQQILRELKQILSRFKMFQDNCQLNYIYTNPAITSYVPKDFFSWFSASDRFRFISIDIPK